MGHGVTVFTYAPAPLAQAARQPSRPPCPSQLLADLRHHLGFGSRVTGSGEPELT